MMKRTFFVCAIFLLYSCSKENVPKLPVADFSLLQTYDWRNITQSEQPFHFDSSVMISYSDTSQYSFTHNQYRYKGQGTMIQYKMGGGVPTYSLKKTESVTLGAYQLHASDSSITMEYRTKVGHFPAWGVEGKDTILHTKYKILVLTRERLELKSVPYKPTTVPFLETVRSYTAIDK